MSEIAPKLRGVVPSGVAGGLRYGLEELAKDPFKVRAAVILFSGDTVAEKSDGTSEIRFTVRRWETVTADDDLLALRDIMQSLAGLRVGNNPMPEEMLAVEGEAFDEALERRYERNEATDLLRHGSGLHVGGGSLDEPEPGRPEGTARGTHNLPGLHG
jgi:hypothetical protein